MVTGETCRKTWRDLEFAADNDMVLLVSGGVQHADTLVFHGHEGTAGGPRFATSLRHPLNFPSLKPLLHVIDMLHDIHVLLIL